jgi:hypothetical protein
MRLSRVIIIIIPFCIALYGLTFVLEDSFAVNNKEKQPRTEAVTSDGKVVITSPEDGSEIYGDSLEVTFEIVDKGARGDHVHLFLDEKLLKPVYGKSYKIKRLTKGEHTISIKLASKNHIILGPEASIKIVVE